MVKQSTIQDATPTPKKSNKTPVIIGVSIAAVLFLGLLVAAAIQASKALGPVFTAVGTSIDNQDKKEQSLAALEAQNKDFALGQTMQYGPIDVTAVSVAQADQPTQAELDYITKQYTPKKLDFQNAEAYYGLDIQDPQYVRVTVTVQYNAARADSTSYPTLDGEWGTYLNSVMLDDRAPLIYYVDGALRSSNTLSYKDTQAIAAGTPFEFQYLYRAPKTGAAGQLSAQQRVYTKTSAIVGTEGMPTKEFTYTLQLW